MSARTAVLRFSAFNQRTTPEIDGTVTTRLGRPRQGSKRRNERYYSARIAIPQPKTEGTGADARSRNACRGLHPHGDRTVVSYLMKPLSDQINKAFRER